MHSCYSSSNSFISLFRKRVNDAVKRLDDKAGLDSDEEGDFLDPFHPDLFKPFVKKESVKDEEGFAIPKPVKVRKSNKKGESGIISVGMGADKQIRLKFKPRYREDAVVKQERIDEPELHTPQSDQSKAKLDDKMSVDPTDEKGGDDVVVEGSGFSLVDY